MRSTDNSSGGRGFDMDPLELLSQPELERILALPSDEQEEAAFAALKVIRALLGFSWGFTLAAGQATIVPAAVLDRDAWNAHIPMLTANYPDWTFAPDFHG